MAVAGGEDATSRGRAIGQAVGFEHGFDRGGLGFQLAVPLRHLRPQPFRRLLAMALLAGVFYAEPVVVPGAGNRDGMIGPGVPNVRPDAGLLEVGHVARDAAAGRRRDAMMRMALERLRFARMAIQTLSVIKPALERGTAYVAVTLAVRVMAVHTAQGPVQITVAGEVTFLVRELPGPAVREVEGIEEERQGEREMLLQRRSGQVPRLQRSLHGVALEANLQRLILGEGTERPHADVGSPHFARSGKVGVSPPGTMA